MEHYSQSHQMNASEKILFWKLKKKITTFSSINLCLCTSANSHNLHYHISVVTFLNCTFSKLFEQQKSVDMVIRLKYLPLHPIHFVLKFKVTNSYKKHKSRKR